jgi:hypothetical protein
VDSHHIAKSDSEDRLSSLIVSVNPVTQGSVAVAHIMSHGIARVVCGGSFNSLQVGQFEAFVID